MTDMELIKLAEEAGFHAAVIPAKDIPVDGSFRKFCEDNLCGKYNANYSCPPACGTVEEVHRRLFQQEKALVVEMIWDVNGFDDKEFIFSSRNKLNRTVLKLMDQLREAGMEGFCLGYGGCPLCNPCKQSLGEPCAFPGKKISCLSAYCIDVGKLASKCHLPFAWSHERLHLFGLIAFRENV